MESESSSLVFTGERMVPGESDPTTFLEHIHRYRFASRFIKGKRVLDIACGEGYGADALQNAGAASIVGIDIAEDACIYARSKYGIAVLIGDAEDIPVQDSSVDIIVSFETIEHLTDPVAFLSECVRVLTPGGKAIISTPNRPVYRRSGRVSTFHYSEMMESEFIELLARHFRSTMLFSQQPTRFSLRRPLAVATLPRWLGLTRANRLRDKMIQMSCPYIRHPEVISKDPVSVRELMLAPEHPLSMFVNPFQVIKSGRGGQDDPVYFVAVASV